MKNNIAALLSVLLLTGSLAHAGNGDLTVNGAVGVGTTSPSARLHVSAGDASLGLFGPNSTWGSKLYVGASPSLASENTAQVVTTNGNLHLDAATGRNIYIGSYTPSNTFMNVNGGNVGIGPAAPNYKLDVAGTVSFSGQAANLDPNAGISLAPLQNSGKVLVGWNAVAGSGETDFIGNRGLGIVGGFNFYDLSNAGTLTNLMKLDGNGNLWVKGSVTEYSDIALKRDIVPISETIGKLKSLRVVNYQWKDSKRDQGRQLGVIAQEVEAVFPELVKETKNPDCTTFSDVCEQPTIKGVDYSKLAAVAIQGVKELSDKVDGLEKRLEKLEGILKNVQQ